jgi:phage tail-like protein
VDVNGTRFHLIQGHTDWSACLEDGLSTSWSALSWSTAGEVVTLTPLLPVVAPPRGGAPLNPSLRRGAAADRLGHWYWIGVDRQSIYWLPQGTQQVLLLWPQTLPSPTPPAGSFTTTATAQLPTNLALSGLAVTHHNYLVVGCSSADTATPAGLLVFDLASGGRPSLLLLPPEVPFAPFDIATSADGGCWVLDRQHRSYWGFDRDFQAMAHTVPTASLPSEFQPVDPAAPPVAAAPPQPAGFPVVAPDPIAIEGLPDGSVLILDGTAETAPATDETTASTIFHYRFGTQLGGPVQLSGAADLKDDTGSGLQTVTLAVIAHDFAYDPDTNMLYAADRFGRQSLAFAVTLTPALSLLLSADYLPMHLFGGRALVSWRNNGVMTVSYDVVGNAAAKDLAVRWARLQPIDQSTYARDAVLVTPLLDGKASDCLWDGLFLDACIPPGATVTISTYADNDAQLAGDPEATFSVEPQLYLRPAGSELPYYNPFPNCATPPVGQGTWEVLLQQVTGRYLRVRLELSGNGLASPQLKALRVYYPRFSYVRQYLPAVYSQDPTSASFVERLLANPKGFYTTLEGKIRNIGCLFDPRTTPPDALDWLASWLGLTLDPLWQTVNQQLQTGTTTTKPAPDRRRLLIRFATRLFTWRGTANGIRFALHLLLEPYLEATLLRFKLAALTPDPALVEVLDGLGLPAPNPFMSENDIEDLLTQYLLSPMRPSKIRIVERFMTRGGLATVVGDPTETGGATDDSIAATAHRFAVLVPETLSADLTTMVSRIVDLEKPAHTDYEVRQYWDYFRVGEARLGIDTMLGEDARFVPMILGQNALSAGYLAYPPPMNAADRVVLNRDRLGAMPAL